MNVPDLRHVDFDAYRQRARELHLEAIESSIDHVLAWAARLLRRQHRAAATVAAPLRTAAC
jgi:hypothetical protein